MSVVPKVDSDVTKAVKDANLLVLNAYASSIATSLARGAIRGRMPGWQAIKAMGQLQEMASNVQFGDPNQYIGGLGGYLPPNPPNPPNNPPQESLESVLNTWAKKTFKPEALL